MMSEQWFVVQVHTNREKWVGTYLENNGFNNIVLLQKEMRQWTDRLKCIDKPVFPGYVFCQFAMERRSHILAVPWVRRIVGVGRTAVPVAEEEITALQVLHRTTLPLQRWPYLRDGDVVRINGGSLDGLMGRFVRMKKSCRMVVSVMLLQRSVAVEVDEFRVTPMTPQIRAIQNDADLSCIASGIGSEMVAKSGERVHI